MLILTRRIGEKIIIGSNIEITLLSIRGGQVRLGVVAPKELSVHREEIYQKIEQLPNVETVSTASQESESH